MIYYLTKFDDVIESDFCFSDFRKRVIPKITSALEKKEQTQALKRPRAETNARTDKLYMMHALTILFHQLMAETGETRLLSQKDVIYQLVT